MKVKKKKKWNNKRKASSKFMNSGEIERIKNLYSLLSKRN